MQSFRIVALATVCLCAFGTLCTPLPAQNPNEAAASSPAADAPDGRAADSAWDRLIYVPFRNLKEALDKQKASVFVPYLEYLKLWEKGGDATTPGKPPVAAVIAESHYKARIDKHVARIEAQFKVQVLGKAWAEVPVKFGAAAVGKLSSEGDKVLLRGTGAGSYALLFPEQGDQAVTLELVARIRTSPDGQSFELDVPTVGITTFELVIPEADQSVELVPQLVAETAAAAEGEKETRITANLGSTPKISASWHPRTSLKPLMELLTSVTNNVLVSIQDGLVHTDAYLEYEILRGELSDVQIAVPADHRILGVSSPNARVEEWKVEAAGNRQLVTVKFLGQVEKKATVEVHTERPLPDEAFDIAGTDAAGAVHGIHAVGAVRESGQLVVAHASDLTLTVEQQQGLTRIEEAEVYQSIRRAGGFSFKFYSPKFALKLTARPIEPRVTVNHNTRLVFHEDELRLKADLAYAIERAGIFELRLKVPEELSIDNVTGEGVKEHSVDAGSQTLIVSLAEKRQGAVTLTVTAHRPLDAKAEEQQVSLPILEPLNVARELGRVAVYAPESIELIVDEGKLVSAQPEPVTQAEQLPNVRLASAWSYTRRPVEIAVTTRRRPTRLTATVASLVTAKQELVEVVSRLTFNVQYAGVDTFRFSVPEALADRVQIRSLASAAAPAIKQKSRAAEAADGWVTWTVVMQREVSGAQPFEVTWDLKYGGDKAEAEAADGDKRKEGAAAADAAAENGDNRVTVQPLRALGLEQESDAKKVTLVAVAGEIAVEKERALALSARPPGEGLEPIDVRELQFLPQTGYLAYRYFRQPVEVTLTATRHEIQPVVETVISRALAEVVIGRDNKASYRCRYLIKSSERQQLRIDLEEGSEPLGQWVDGRAVSLEKSDSAAGGAKPQAGAGWESYFVNVSRAGTSDEPFTLTLQFLLPLSPFEAPSGELQLKLPRIGGQPSTGIAVQQLRIAVWMPEDYSLVGTPHDFVRERHAGDLDGWVGVAANKLFDFPTEGTRTVYSSLGDAAALHVDWWRISSITWIVSGAIVIIALVLLKTSWENKLGILILAGFVLVVSGLRDMDFVTQTLRVAQYGLATMAGLWLLHALFGARNSVHIPAAAPPPATLSQGTTVAAVIPPPGVFEMINELHRDKRS